MENIQRSIAAKLYRHGIFRIGDFKLTSGKISPYYIDLRLLPSYYDLYSRIIDEAVKLLNKLKYDVIIGVETAGIIHAGFLACKARAPAGYVRVKRKEHGTGRMVEAVAKNKRVIIIDDVATTGGSIAKAVSIVRGEGGIVEEAMVIVDRCEGAAEKLRGMGVRLHSVFKVGDIIRILGEEEIINRKEYTRLAEYCLKNCSCF